MICTHEGCTTPLTRFDKAKEDPTKCWLHQPEKDWNYLGIYFAFCETCEELVQVRKKTKSGRIQCADCRSQFAQLKLVEA